jgi:Sulfocyanin (SoxE) domain
VTGVSSSMMRLRPPAALALLAALALGVCACGGSARGPGSTATGRSTAAATGKRPSAERWLSVGSRARTATITLIAGYDERANGFNLDGAVKGALLFAVPEGWTVRIRCVNGAAGRRYSCMLTRGAGSPPSAAPALNVLYPARGLAPRAAATFSLGRLPPSLYRLAVVSGGRQPAGMWVVLKVSASDHPYARWLR